MWTMKTQFTKVSKYTQVGGPESVGMMFDTEAEAMSWWDKPFSCASGNCRTQTMTDPNGVVTKVRFKSKGQ